LLKLTRRHRQRSRGKPRSWTSLRASGEDAPLGDEEDWRDFRAKLVQAELSRGGEDGGEEEATKNATEGWAYVSPLIEQGSILLSTPSDHFAINQQYFHKNVIFLVEHSDTFTRGVILNRPTAYSTSDLEDSVPNFTKEGIDDWNVWCGGDCQGINERGTGRELVYSVIHGLEHLAARSQRIIRGVYSIELADAKALVAAGEADKDDFLLLVGYCGWAPGQLQSELDRGDSWTMAAADQQTVLGELRTAQAALRKRIADATRGEVFTAGEVGDGLATWERLYSALGPKFQGSLTEFKATGDSEHTDEMLRRWINRCLIPNRYSPEKLPAARVAEIALNSTGSGSELKAGTILRGSPTAWILGKPAEHEMFETRRFVPGQYFHKAVGLLIRDYDEGSPALVALVNGPVVSEDSDGPLLWGGPASTGEVRVNSGDGAVRVSGFTLLLPGTLELLMDLGALEVAPGVDIETLLRAPVEERWQVAGGTIDTLADARTAQLGDVQRRKWYQRFLEIDVP